MLFVNLKNDKDHVSYTKQFFQPFCMVVKCEVSYFNGRTWITSVRK